MMRVMRGGSFWLFDNPNYLRGAFRILDDPDYDYAHRGFRVAWPVTSYHVEAWAPPGVQCDQATGTLEDVTEAARAMRDRWPHATLAFSNIDRADVDTDGLTDDEREQLEQI